MYSTRKINVNDVPVAGANMLTIFPDLNGVWQQKDENGNVFLLVEGVEPVNVTYTELTTLISNTNLVPGKLYRITDYATIYNVPGTSPTVELTATTEPIIVKAVSNNTLYARAYSESNPNDIIFYNVSPTVGVRNCTANSKGIITHRIDTVNNNCYPADFRGVIVRRWDNGSGSFEVLAENGNASQDVPVFGANCFNNIVNTQSNIEYTALGVTDNLPHTYFPANSVNNTLNTVYGLTFLATVKGFQVSDVVYNVLFKNTVQSVLGTTFKTCVFDGTIANCTFLQDVTTSNFAGTMSNNTFIGKVTNSSIECSGAFNDNYFGGEIRNSNLNATSFAQNYFACGIDTLTATTSVGNITNNRVLGVFNTCTLTNLSTLSFCTFVGDVTTLDFNTATIITNLHIDGKCSNLTITSDINNLKISGLCDSLTINGSQAINNVTFVTGVTTLTITTVSVDLNDSTIYSEVVHDTTSGNWYERKLTAGSTYSYVVIP